MSQQKVQRIGRIASFSLFSPTVLGKLSGVNPYVNLKELNSMFNENEKSKRDGLLGPHLKFAMFDQFRFRLDFAGCCFPEVFVQTLCDLVDGLCAVDDSACR